MIKNVVGVLLLVGLLRDNGKRRKENAEKLEAAAVVGLLQLAALMLEPCFELRSRMRALLMS